MRSRLSCSLDGIAPGKLTVQVELEEYVPQEKEVEVTEDETQALKFVLERARPDVATGVKLTADPANSSIKGTSVTFKAEGSGGTGNYEYRFLKKGRATADKWVRTQKYSSKNTWTWMTKDDDVGSNRIGVHVRSSGSTAGRGAQKLMSFEIKTGKLPSPDRKALEELLGELEQKIEDGDKRMVAHPTFLDELRDLLKRYKKRIAP